MENALDLWEKPTAKEIYLIAGWHQWADAGMISSGLPEYLIKQTAAKKIGEIKPDGFYLFQIPGTHDLLRPEIKLEEGHRKSLRKKTNEFYYAGDEETGLLIFLGDEPHLDAERYGKAFFEALQTIGVKQGAVVGGVYGPVPYDKDRSVSCTYSLPTMKDEMSEYAVRFSNYEGGVTISAYMVDRAEQYQMPFLAYHVLVPIYDLSQLSKELQGIGIDNDFKAWYDLMRRFNVMFKLDFDLEDLQKMSDELVISMDSKIGELDYQMPQLKVRQYLAELTSDFEENSFMPLGDVWKEGLDDLFDDLDDEQERS
jgi:proteasome assembly chaperone (PAC2) family protein